jgi:hypothetical protein
MTVAAPRRLYHVLVGYRSAESMPRAGGGSRLAALIASLLLGAPLTLTLVSCGGVRSSADASARRSTLAQRAAAASRRDEVYADAGTRSSARFRKLDHDGDPGTREGYRPHSQFDADDVETRYFGHSASAHDRRSITALVDRYYAAAARDDGRMACSAIDAGLVAGAELAEGSHGPSSPATAGCAAAMAKMLAQAPGRTAADFGAVRVLDVRVRGSEAIALLRLRDARTREMPVLRERGVWKIDAFFDNGLP